MKLIDTIKRRLYSLKKILKNGKEDESTLLPSPLEWKLFDRISYYDKLPFDTFNPVSTSKLSVVAYMNKESVNVLSLQNKINDISSQGGGFLFLPEGKFILEKSIKIHSNVHLSGFKDRTQIIFDNTHYGFIIEGETTDKQISNISLSNLTIFHRGNCIFCATIFATYAKDITFKNIHISHPRSTGFLLSDFVSHCNFKNCDVSYAALTGYMFVRSVEDISLYNCSAENCLQSGLFLTDLKLPKNIEQKNFDAQLHHTNTIIGNFAPFEFDDPAPYRINITNCRFRYNRKMGITTDGVGHLTINNCIIAHNDNEGITIDNGSWNCHIQNCHIFDNGKRAKQTEEELGIDFVTEMGLLEDGSSKAKLPGISIDNAAYTKIDNNFIESNWGDGIKFVRASYLSIIRNNTIKNNNLGKNDKFHFFGILIGNALRQHPNQDDFASRDNIIEDNIITGAHFSAIHLLPNTLNNKICNNILHEFEFEAIENHTTSGNIISNNDVK